MLIYVSFRFHRCCFQLCEEQGPRHLFQGDGMWHLYCYVLWYYSLLIHSKKTTTTRKLTTNYRKQTTHGEWFEAKLFRNVEGDKMRSPWHNLEVSSDEDVDRWSDLYHFTLNMRITILKMRIENSKTINYKSIEFFLNIDLH